jgi:hypothetical protein
MVTQATSRANLVRAEGSSSVTALSPDTGGLDLE